MSYGTPITNRIRKAWITHRIRKSFRTAPEASQEFDRWLASVKAEAMETGYNLGFVDGVKQSKAEAWDEGARWMRRSMRMTALDNPYRETEQ